MVWIIVDPVKRWQIWEVEGVMMGFQLVSYVALQKLGLKDALRSA